MAAALPVETRSGDSDPHLRGLVFGSQQCSLPCGCPRRLFRNSAWCNKQPGCFWPCTGQSASNRYLWTALASQALPCTTQAVSGSLSSLTWWDLGTPRAVSSHFKQLGHHWKPNPELPVPLHKQQQQQQPSGCPCILQRWAGARGSLEEGHVLPLPLAKGAVQAMGPLASAPAILPA